jgi:hypothetical protein
MAKKGGKSSGYVSAGINSNVNPKIRNANRSEYLKSPERLINQLNAFREGKNVVVTLENPNKNETNKRSIRVKARDIWKQLPKNNGIAS